MPANDPEQERSRWTAEKSETCTVHVQLDSPPIRLPFVLSSNSPFLVLVTNLYVPPFGISTAAFFSFPFPHLFFIHILRFRTPQDVKCGILHFYFCARLVTVYLYVFFFFYRRLATSLCQGLIKTPRHLS